MEKDFVSRWLSSASNCHPTPESVISERADSLDFFFNDDFKAIKQKKKIHHIYIQTLKQNTS